MEISKHSNIGIVCDKNNELALSYAKKLITLLPAKILSTTSSNVDLIISIGGDGTMLHSVHKFRHLNSKFYGINTGSVGFLMNELNINKHKTTNSLLKILNHTEEVLIYPLEMEVIDINNKNFKALAINEVYLFRESYQTAQMEISINNKAKLKSFVGDGIILSTPAGSTAYNLSAGGPILPIDSNLLALTPISPFRPRRWKGALLTNESEISIKILHPKNRPVSAVADFLEIRDVKKISIKSSKDISIKLLFDKNQNFEEKITKEQFLY